MISVLNIIIPLLVLAGLWMMSRVSSSVNGNRTSILAMILAILVAFWGHGMVPLLCALFFILVGLVIGFMMARKVKMIEMPEMVGLLNGLGGGASALVGIVTLMGITSPEVSITSAGMQTDSFSLGTFESSTGVLAVIVGMITLVGSLIAAGKLHRVIDGRPKVIKNHSLYLTVSLALCGILFIWSFFGINDGNATWIVCLSVLFAALFGGLFTIRVGGADMPITISLLNSLSGVAGSIAGMAIGNVMLVAIGGIVGASGLLLTQIMCRAMNRSLGDILLGKTAAPAGKKTAAPKAATPAAAPAAPAAKKEASLPELLHDAKRVIIVPGYGMALAQAQHQVKQLADTLRRNGAEVRFAIHPVAGRMPGHMNVLLAEADVPYDDLFEMERINDDFKDTDLVVVIGANDVLNPAAREAEGTPIYGMPVLNVDQAKHIVICNYDLKPGYAGVENPLYTRKEGVTMCLGDAKETVADLVSAATQAPAKADAAPDDTAKLLHDAKRVIIVPGYGMALAQAQHQVKQLADTLRRNGAEVRFAIHPVAGRMPGHMNVLLAEADVPYDDLFEMERINDDFKSTDLVIVIGANDVLNPAAREAEGTPIYGMPVLNVDQAKHIVICNYDLKPGYAGVENPLYTRKEGVTMCLGDAKETVADLVSAATQAPAKADAAPDDTAKLLHEAKEVIIVPGYGMALAQAQHEVKHLADALTRNGAHVRFAIHPVAGRMPGHMNVLLAEADVPYDDLFEMERINDDFKSTDLVIVIGANDVLNPAAREAEGTPIYGMPVLNVDQAKHIIICNYDLKPGYAGVENPLYTRKEGVTMCLGDAKEMVGELLAKTTAPLASAGEPTELSDEGALLHESKRVIIVPGYGMALAQAQHEVKGLADTLRRNGAEVRFAIHPVAGRMPGHMNVLLAEADVPYDDLFEMERINDDFKETDLVIVIGANDVLNPAAREAEGTPIYGMPVLNVDQAKHIIICNYDLKPGYAGVENPLYTRKEGVTLKLGDAKETVAQLAAEAAAAPSEVKKATGGPDLSKVLTDAKKVIIVPGYGMALAQAQHLVKQLADTLSRKGAEVRFAIHPVAGRMPGHMNVLLAEADVPYDDLFEMERINDDFKDTDLVIVIGANDVLNPAAREAEGTPIYGMPVLNVDQAKYVIICNYDLNPGYAGVPNPLYERESGVTLLLGDANKTVADLVAAANA